MIRATAGFIVYGVHKDGLADPSQWMKMFGVDIDSRDTTELILAAQQISDKELEALKPRIDELFGGLPDESAVNERSIRLYLAIKKLVADYEWDFYTIQSFPGLADDYAATCFAQSMMLDDERLYPIWQRAGELGVPVLIHVSDPTAFFDPIDAQNEHYITLQEFPGWSFFGSQ